MINYTIKELDNAEYFFVPIKYLVDTKDSFDANNEPKYITSDESRS